MNKAKVVFTKLAKGNEGTILGGTAGMLGTNSLTIGLSGKKRLALAILGGAAGLAAGKAVDKKILKK